MSKIFFLLALIGFAVTPSWSLDSWFSAELPIGSKKYPITARIHTQKFGDTLKFSTETQYRGADTSFSMHSTGAFNVKTNLPIWQNSIRDGLYSVEWSFRDWTEKPAALYWRGTIGDGSLTFENDAVPEEFLYFIAEKIDPAKPFLDFKVLSPVWEVPFEPNAWTATAQFTNRKQRIQGVDCYQVFFTRSDGKIAEYYLTEKGRQVWRFQTFRGMWFERVQ
ncbi:hypothetical protein AGMMS49938_08520 [Fibrobacterales bacterium]|nr:hypothetical protein AGMMS49938_08500 [Fibrobacterales bacterium]GHV13648.1 hypothetical protein AGMMS49938_08520 [Fibrobacterales bacterium]